jgi:hypothetical protein
MKKELLPNGETSCKIVNEYAESNRECRLCIEYAKNNVDKCRRFVERN